MSAAEKTTALGPGLVTSGGTFSGLRGAWYVVEIVGAGSQATATFRWSDWFDAIVWNETEIDCGDGTEVPLSHGVVVRFSGEGAADFQVGERWEFYAALPFLRAPLDFGDNASGERFCRDCHRAWAMDHLAVNTYDGSLKSHPVGIPLNAGGRGYDRALPLDGNGSVQESPGADSNSSNDLQLDPTGCVQCLSCHGVHRADGNTLTE